MYVNGGGPATLTGSTNSPLIRPHDGVAFESEFARRGQHHIARAHRSAYRVENGAEVAVFVELGEHPVVVVELLALAGCEPTNRGVLRVRRDLVEVVITLGRIAEPAKPKMASLHLHSESPLRENLSANV